MKDLEVKSSNEFSFVEMFFLLWKNKFLILASTILSIFIGVYYLKTTEYLYEASVNILPADSALQSDGSDYKGVGSIAGMFGIPFRGVSSSSGVPSFKLYKSILKSRLNASELGSDTNLLKSMFPGEFNPDTGEWIKPEPNLSIKTKNLIKSILGIRIYDPKPPGKERIFEFVEQNVQVLNDSETGITKIKIFTDKPKMGVFLIKKLHFNADNILKKRANKKAVEYINYLVKELEKTYQTDQRESLIQNLSKQQKNKMISTGTLPFSAEVLGEFNISSRHVYPRATSVLLIAFLSGVFIGIFITFFKYQFE